MGLLLIFALCRLFYISEEYEENNARVPGGGFTGCLHNPLTVSKVSELIGAMGLNMGLNCHVNTGLILNQFIMPYYLNPEP